MPQQNQEQMPLGKHIHLQCKSNTKSKTIAVSFPHFWQCLFFLFTGSPRTQGEGCFVILAKVIHEQDRQML